MQKKRLCNLYYESANYDFFDLMSFNYVHLSI